MIAFQTGISQRKDYVYGISGPFSRSTVLWCRRKSTRIPKSQVVKVFRMVITFLFFFKVRTLLNLSEFCFCQIQPPGASRRVDESKCSGGETEKQIAGELPGYKLWYIGLNYRMDYSFWKKENIADKEMIMLSFPFCVNAHVRRESTCLKSWYWTCRRDVVRLIRRWNILLKLFFRVEFMFAM